MQFGQSCNNYKNWADYMDKVDGIDNLRGQIKISADNVTTADSLHADSMAGMEEG